MGDSNWPMPMESSSDNPSESPDAAGGAWFRWLSVARVADATLFAATINLVSIPLAGGIDVSAWGLGVASPSLGVSVLIWLAAAVFCFGRPYAGKLEVATARA